jgi:hypothetical protein
MPWLESKFLGIMASNDLLPVHYEMQFLFLMRMTGNRFAHIWQPSICPGTVCYCSMLDGCGNIASASYPHWSNCILLFVRSTRHLVHFLTLLPTHHYSTNVLGRMLKKY